MMSSQLKFVPTVDRITIESNIPLESTINPFIPIGPSFTPQIPTLFNYESLPSPLVSEAAITLKYDRAGFTVFAIRFIHPFLAAGNYYEMRAFGQFVISETKQTSGFVNIPEALVVSNDVSQDTVEIYIRGVLPLIQSTFGISILGFQNVFSNMLVGDRCTNACPEKAGFEVALNVGTPYECTFCDTSLFLEFNHASGGCKCIDRYYQDTAGDCQPCQDTLCKLCPPAGADCD